MPKVSVVMNCYNHGKFLQQAIDSVLCQTLEDWELLIMDDNSDDPKVQEILESLSDERIKIFVSTVEEQDRYATARYAVLINRAVNTMATGEYITYLVDDDYYYPQRLEVMSNYLDENPGVQICYSAQDVVDEDGHKRGVRKFDEPLKKAWDAVDHNSVMHRKDLFFQVGGWPEARNLWGGADAIFFKSINDLGILFYPVPNHVSLEAKRYHTDSVQWKIANDCFGK